MEQSFSFEGLKAYQVARELVKNIYLLQNSFPKEERYALGDQVRRAAISITANRRTKQVQSQACLSYALQGGGRR